MRLEVRRINPPKPVPIRNANRSEPIKESLISSAVFFCFDVAIMFVVPVYRNDIVRAE